MSFESPGLEQTVWGSVLQIDSVPGVPPTEHLACDEVEALSGLGLDSLGVTSLVGIQNLVGLRNFGSTQNAIADLTPLTLLPNFDGVLTVRGAGLTDISPVSSLTELTSLDLGDNGITVIPSLSGLTELTVLTLDQNQITDISPIAELPSIELVQLADNAIRDIAPLNGLQTLGAIWINRNQIQGALAELDDLPALVSLRADSNRLQGIAPAFGRGSPNLEHLSMAENTSATGEPAFPWMEGSPIPGIAAMRNLAYLDLTDTPIGTFEPILAFGPLFSNSDFRDGDQVFLKGTRFHCSVKVELEAKGVNVWVGNDCT